MSKPEVLILSKREAGGVRFAAEILREREYSPVLLSALADDRNAEACDRHLVVDWDSANLARLVDTVAEHDVSPVAVVNMVEPLIPWQIAIAEHYRLPGMSPGQSALLSKLRVREFLSSAGLSSLEFCGGTCGDLSPDDVDFFPVIVKPSQDSGGSRFVSRAESPPQLRQCLDHLAEVMGAEAEVLVEEFVDGVEFTIDGFVLDGSFEGLFRVEKLQHDEALHHDVGLHVSPPQSVAVQSAADQLVKTLDSFCGSLGLTGMWLHAEGRARPDGSAELIEINPRPGGSLNREAITRSCGIDPCQFLVHMALPGADRGARPKAARDASLVGILNIEAFELGRVEILTSADELHAIPGVTEVRRLDGIVVDSLEQENRIAHFLLTGKDVQALRSVEAEVVETLRYRVTPLADSV